MKGIKRLILLSVPLLFTACGDGGMLPASSGKPYEAVVVNDQNDSISHLLQQEVEGLPQAEPMFDVTSIRKAEMKGIMKLARCIVFFDKTTPLRIEKNVYAKPQIIVHTDGSHQEELLKLLNRFEMTTQIANLKRKQNVKAQTEIKKMFGVSMLIPADLTAMKKGKNFLWISNNTATGMKNICIYTFRSKFLSMNNPQRDSIFRANIKGETDGMYLKAIDQKVVIEGNQKNPKFKLNGLWEMENDAMGGPFEEHIQRIKDHYIAAFAFVYAPEMKKRNLMRQLDASLYTLKNN
jgi:hypothetical protein